MINHRKLFGGLLALGLVLGAGSAFGQITGTILGTVSDDQGLVLPGHVGVRLLGPASRRSALGGNQRFRAVPVPQPSPGRLHPDGGALRFRDVYRGGDASAGRWHRGEERLAQPCHRCRDRDRHRRNPRWWTPASPGCPRTIRANTWRTPRSAGSASSTSRSRLPACRPPTRRAARAAASPRSGPGWTRTSTSWTGWTSRPRFPAPPGRGRLLI